jgi:hypothetical protein
LRRKDSYGWGFETLEVAVTVYFKVPSLHTPGILRKTTDTLLAVVRNETFALLARTAMPHYGNIFVVNCRLSVTYLGGQYSNMSWRQKCNKSAVGFMFMCASY